MGDASKRPSTVITASEIGQYTYCANAWFLHRCGYEPHSPALEHGTQVHTAMGTTLDVVTRREKQTSRMIALGLLLLLLALLAVFLGVIL